MNVITTSREYGVGGGEVARQPAEIRCWEWLDLALFHLAALIANLADAELKRLDEKGTDFGGTVSSSSDASEMPRGPTEAARRAAARSNVLFVGRGTWFAVGNLPNTVHLRLVALCAWRAERMARLEGWSWNRLWCVAGKRIAHENVFRATFFRSVRS